MKTVGKLQITTPTDREIAMTRSFNAPRQKVFDCFTKPELVKRWLSGPPGWTMVTCEIDLRVGGKYRYAWSHEKGQHMGMGGVYRDVAPPERIVATELFDDAWYAGEAVGTLVLTERAGVTTITQTVRYESKEARDGVLKSPMEQGVAYGYDKLEAMLDTL
jgi:uncharacterized protein YndB with AHSA1/START domain